MKALGGQESFEKSINILEYASDYGSEKMSRFPLGIDRLQREPLTTTADHSSSTLLYKSKSVMTVTEPAE
jgi:hypothetical protein